MNVRLLICSALVFNIAYVDAQDWSSWQKFQNDQVSVQYCYRLSPVSSGNSFSFKIRNNSLASVCGEFLVVLNMINGQKQFSYSFKDLKSGMERSCPGVYQFSDVRSFASISGLKIGYCGQSEDASGAPASFTVDYHNDAGKGGKFRFTDPKGAYSFEATALSGHNKAADNPATQQFNKTPDREVKHGKPLKGFGTIPSGTWYISSIKNRGKAILRLTPSPDVANPNNRDGFLIHGYETTPENASTGCIILDKVYRDKLMKAFLRDGRVVLKIQNKEY
jgi:hypothetical protein